MHDNVPHTTGGRAAATGKGRSPTVDKCTTDDSNDDDDDDERRRPRTCKSKVLLV